MLVRVDCHEVDRIPKALNYYSEARVEELPIGDYLFNDEVVFEYKKFNDFLSSIEDHRVFNQGLEQREVYQYHFIILEMGERFCLDEHLGWGNVVEKGYYNAFARLDTYTTVIPVFGDERKCFEVMEWVAEKCLDDKVLVKYPEVKTGNSALNFLCNNIRGVGRVTAEKITMELGLENLEDLIGLRVEDLVKVEGVGCKTAGNIIGKIKRDRGVE